MRYFVDTSFDSLKKKDEELCGDMVEIIKVEDSTVIVLADGLGSGVKANILATLTSRIAGTMIKGGADIYETVHTIINTLPICSERHIAYSTFTIMKIDKNGKTYAVEYENPPFFLIRKGESIKIDKKETIINERKVLESNFCLQENDVITIVSDGVLHAGEGNVLNMGWQWSDVESYLLRSSGNKKCAKNISRDLMDACWYLYGCKPGDDATAIGIKIKRPQYVDLFTGPPEDKDKDAYVINELMRGKGKKIICGGTAANIAERILKRDLVIDPRQINSEIPPIFYMEGVDLITEGVVTLNKAVEIIRKYTNSFLEEGRENILKGEDGAIKLSRILLEECTHLNMWIGKAWNKAYDNEGFYLSIGIKMRLVEELCELMQRLGRIVKINYV